MHGNAGGERLRCTNAEAGDRSRVERHMSVPMCLYRNVMGPSFDNLPAEVQRFHSLRGRWTLDGRVTIFGGQTRIGARLCWVMGLSGATAEAPMQFQLSADPEREVW